MVNILIFNLKRDPPRVPLSPPPRALGGGERETLGTRLINLIKLQPFGFIYLVLIFSYGKTEVSSKMR